MTTKLTLKLLLIFFAVLLLPSCTAYKRIPYLQEAETLTQTDLKSATQVYEPSIKPNDVLSIIVNSQTPGIATAFNMPLLPPGSQSVNQNTNNESSDRSGTLQNYLVDKDGFINFPVLGKILVGGLTKLELQRKITDLIYPKFIAEEPIVNVRFLNYKVSVLGEVAKPGVYTTENEVMTLFDALAFAGDLTIYGKRDNVMLIRQAADGELSIHRINLQDKNLLLNKDIYYLQQNDKIIVEANKTKGNSSSIGTVESLGLSAVSILISVIAIITR